MENYDLHPDRVREALAEQEREDQMAALCRRFQSYIDAPDGGTRTEWFSVDDVAWYRVSPAQWRELMAMAPLDIQAFNDDPSHWPDQVKSLDPEGDSGPPWGAWPDLSGEHNVLEILAAIRLVDWHLDAAAPAIYKTNPLANRWRRIAAGPASEGREAVDALNLATGGNPRKGVIGDDDTILAELGDGAVANLLAIQSILKDTDATWSVFIAALSKALSRVPDARPA